MGQILKTEDKPLDEGTVESPAMMNVQAHMIPSFRTVQAIERGVNKNILLLAIGGLGDLVCTEPAFRFAVNHFTDCEFSIAARNPEIFQHLKFKQVFNLSMGFIPNTKEFLVFQSLHDGNTLNWEFLANAFCNSIDYHSLNMFRLQMPILEKCVMLQPKPEQFFKVKKLLPEKRWVAIHAGKTWPSKTFPASWWNQVLGDIIKLEATPVILGTREHTVDVDATGCVDLRDRLLFMESVAVVQEARSVLCSDSSMYHAACSGEAWIGLVSTIKHPDNIRHWRNCGEFGWRIKNFERGGLWQTINMCPNNPVELDISKVDPELLLSWLPDPTEFALWGVDKWRTPVQA